MVENKSTELSPEGIFICPSCQKKSKISSIPSRSGSYKITCFNCKQATIVRVLKDSKLAQKEIKNLSIESKEEINLNQSIPEKLEVLKENKKVEILDRTLIKSNLLDEKIKQIKEMKSHASFTQRELIAKDFNLSQKTEVFLNEKPLEIIEVGIISSPSNEVFIHKPQLTKTETKAVVPNQIFAQNKKQEANLNPKMDSKLIRQNVQSENFMQEHKKQNTEKMDTSVKVATQESKTLLLYDKDFNSNRPVTRDYRWEESIPMLFRSKKLVYILPILLIIFVLGLIPLLNSFKQSKEELVELLSELSKNKPTKILDRNGKLISEIFQKRIGSTKLEDYPAQLARIVINVEDKNFREHFGIDILAIGRATLKNIFHLSYHQGASTVTMQLARILIKDRRKNISRKLREAEIAIALESRLNKNQILEAYMNQVYLGHGAFGFENGAMYYFNKKPKELNVKEMVLLASLASAPNKYSPFKNPDLSRRRVNEIVKILKLRNVIEENDIYDLDNFYKALKAPQHATVFGTRFEQAPFITEHARNILLSISPGTNIYYEGNYIIETTLMLDIQTKVIQEIEDHLNFMKDKNKVKRVKIKKTDDLTDVNEELQAAVVGLVPATGEVLFLHGGGENFNSQNQFNRATQMRRQTGSSIKPILYSAAIDTGIFHTGMTILDAPLLYRGKDSNTSWSPANFGQVYDGEISLREALMKSKNTAAVQIGEKLGIPILEKYYSNYFFPDSKEKERRFRYDLSVALGSLEISPLEMASAFSNFSNDGVIKRPLLIKRILDANKRVIYKSEDKDEFQLKVPPERRIIQPDTAEVMVSLMKSSASASGVRKTGYAGEVAGKTGTTNDYVDAWFVGTKPGLSLSVWIGYDDPSYGMGGSGVGSEMAAPLWGRIAKVVDEANVISKGKFKFSKSASWINICKDTGLIATAKCPIVVNEVFVQIQKPPRECNHGHEQIKNIKNKEIKTMFE